MNYDIMDKKIVFTPGYFPFFPNDDEIYIKTNHLSESVFHLKDKYKENWIKSFFEKLSGQYVIKDVVKVVPEKNKKIILKILIVGVKKGYFMEAKTEANSPYWLTNNMYGKEKFLKNSITNTRIASIGLGVLGVQVAKGLLEFDFEQLKLIDYGIINQIHIDHCYEYADKEIGDNKINAYKEFHKKTINSKNVQLIEAMYDSGSDLSKYLSDCNMVIVATDEYNSYLYNIINQLANQYDFKWTLLLIDRWDLYIGPTFIPDQTGCYNCFEKLNRNLDDDHDYYAYNEHIINSENRSLSIHFNPNQASIVSGLFLTDLPNLIGDMPRKIEPENSLTIGKQLRIKTLNFDAEIIHLVKNPYCSCNANVLEKRS
ncbi:ThiF family adenylyltransferase [Bacillus atrophaeus]|uniref:ThiF family adenylyltransferase n=1 Tax=Bacillus atrophaeus TaxID=1452 RepID=UPI0022801686|nr:ThiF family adenylyltransferase [Bacillus atrophaeus]MCY8499606.1 ThiF family adenylyltransferase [Bacillus atrophaeus]MCY8812443.1 ThiF family adenylyltransferase [Bacillus atrophaeus]MCY8822389.1 ThiF family adenylyltransferase [Bacillus atrophaeus]MCY8829235.1 ThiF family adenylyltransferase [Bacillus atrophaeus]MCY8832909.1 ThiF family adenylyltransferase [Bacillus atrophaeus]